MPKDVKAYDLLISCPSDVSKCVNKLEKAVTEFNDLAGRHNNVIVRTRYWSKHTYSGYGDSPQNEVNRQIVDSSDMVVGVFWKRFGTPTENYGSGTEEEIERMHSAGKKVFLYFLNKGVNLSEIDNDQYQKVREFIKKHKGRSFYSIVSSEKALEDKFRNDLEYYFYDKIIHQEIGKRGKKKEILWVDDQPENNVRIRKLFEEHDIEFTLALSTEQALRCMGHNEYSLIISDMGRKEGNREGYVLLDKIREFNKEIPFIIFAGSRQPEHIKETLQHGGQGCTNDSSELINWIIKYLLKS